MWSKSTAETYDRKLHQMYGQRLGAGAISLLSENTGSAAAAVTLVKEREK